MAPQTHPDAEHESKRVLAGTIVVFICGIIIAVVAFFAQNSHALHTADQLVKFNTGGKAFTLKDLYLVVCFVGIGTIIAGLIGLAGVFHPERPQRAAISCYGISLLFFAAFFVVSTTTTFMRNQSVSPIIKRQVRDFCNRTTFVRLTSNIPCANMEFAQTFSLTPTYCGDECKARVDLLKTMDPASHGCDLLGQLCGRYEYEVMGTGYCQVKTATGTLVRPTMYAAAGTMDCKKACNSDVECTGYVVVEGSAPECGVITSGSTQKYTPATWKAVAGEANFDIVGTDSQASVTCNKKGLSMANRKFKTYSLILSWFSLVMTIAILAVTILTLSHLYTVSMRRTGKKGAGALCCLMLCPCMHEEGEDHLTEEVLTDDSDVEGYSG